MFKKIWKESEEKLLKENYNKLPNDKLMELFPYKTYLAVYKKAYSLGLRKSEDIEFINRSNSKRREKSSNWNGGVKKTAKGYVQLLMPEHKRADSAGYVMEHIVVYEKATGIEIPPNCCIHHLNRIKNDNRIENLCMMTISAHTAFHHMGSKRSMETKKKISESKRLKNE